MDTAAAGAVATIVNDALMTPGDVIKQRLQLANSPYTGVIDCVVKTYQSEGLKAFFRSYKLTVRTKAAHFRLPIPASSIACFESVSPARLNGMCVQHAYTLSTFKQP
jgi:hypothetical protein